MTSSFSTVGLIGRRGTATIRDSLEVVLKLLLSRGLKVVVEDDTAEIMGPVPPDAKLSAAVRGDLFDGRGAAALPSGRDGVPPAGPGAQAARRRRQGNGTVAYVVKLRDVRAVAEGARQRRGAKEREEVARKGV